MMVVGILAEEITTASELVRRIGRLEGAEDDDRLIVEVCGAGLKVCYRLQDRVDC